MDDGAEGRKVDAPAGPAPVVRPETAILLAVGAHGILTLMDVLIKQLSLGYATLQIVFLRFAFSLTYILIAIAIVRPGWPSREALRVNGLRSLLVLLTAPTFFYSIAVLPLAEAVAISFLSPMFTALFGALILRERIGPRIGLALVLGFLGMLVIVGGRIGTTGYQHEALLGALSAMVSAIAFAFTMVLLRSRAQRDNLLVVVMFQSLAPAILLAYPALQAWRPPSETHWVMFAAMGLLGFSGHYLLSQAFKRAEAARLAPLEYTALVWATVFGLLLFSEVPGLPTLLGAGLIVASAIATHRP